jgi:hypothetical protein
MHLFAQSDSPLVEQAPDLTCFSPFSLVCYPQAASGNVALILDLRAGNLTVSDPSQTLSRVDIAIKSFIGTTLTFTVQLPAGPGGFAGGRVTQQFSFVS